MNEFLTFDSEFTFSTSNFENGQDCRPWLWIVVFVSFSSSAAWILVSEGQKQESAWIPARKRLRRLDGWKRRLQAEAFEHGRRWQPQGYFATGVYLKKIYAFGSVFRVWRFLSARRFLGNKTTLMTTRLRWIFVAVVFFSLDIIVCCLKNVLKEFLIGPPFNELDFAMLDVSGIFEDFQALGRNWILIPTENIKSLYRWFCNTRDWL